ncbi:hypothetical protein LCGC14_0954840 [marine sediment metagenome]|uniref:Uncharacterized protein n=1 Tax=marine sediment metagenome TaxID=412755 RepID=A0A0F9NG51_9ZZZZ|nr:hypothetical protein [bacterium]
MIAYQATLESHTAAAGLSIRIHGTNDQDAVEEYFKRHFPDLEIIGITDEEKIKDGHIARYWIEHSGRQIETRWTESGPETKIIYHDKITVNSGIK